jgi:BirA family biotin operon repressor/biotin-[acetyl-CoA-carboxylase] ligase
MAILDNYNIIHHPSIDSTNEEAKRLVRSENVLDKTIIRSDIQTAGNGKKRSKWVSEKGNLYLSFITKTNASLVESAKYTFISSLAIGETIRSFVSCNIPINYKWPNDVLLNEKKVSGILLETIRDINNNNWLIIGMGVNINNTPTDIDIDCVSISSFCNGGADIDKFMVNLIENFTNKENIWKNKGFSYIRASWLDNAYKLGQVIKVNLPKEIIEGTFKGISNNGELEIVLNNEILSISSGEVFFE